MFCCFEDEMLGDSKFKNHLVYIYTDLIHSIALHCHLLSLQSELWCLLTHDQHYVYSTFYSFLLLSTFLSIELLNNRWGIGKAVIPVNLLKLDYQNINLILKFLLFLVISTYQQKSLIFKIDKIIQILNFSVIILEVFFTYLFLFPE